MDPQVRLQTVSPVYDRDEETNKHSHTTHTFVQANLNMKSCIRFTCNIYGLRTLAVSMVLKIEKLHLYLQIYMTNFIINMFHILQRRM